MLDVGISRKMIGCAKEIVDFNINIMDNRGIIIASTDQKRIGSFHEAAMNILMSEEDTIEIGKSSNLLGVRNGINMALLSNNEKMGVLGITGEPDVVRPFAHLLKFAMETMFEYEIMKKKESQQLSLTERLINGLISGNTDEDDLLQYAEELNYNMYLYRIPILITFDDKVSEHTCFNILNQNRLHSVQDIKSLIHDNTLLILKYFDNPLERQVYGEYRNMINEYLDDLLKTLQRNDITHYVCIGSFTQRIRDYQNAVRRTYWVNKNHRRKSVIEFFYDHLSNYLKEQLPISELHEIFSFFIKDKDKEFLDSMVTICETLNRNNYNLSDASNELFIHKNTLFLRISKFKDFYGINPMHNTNDRVFFEYLSYYYTCVNEREMC